MLFRSLKVADTDFNSDEIIRIIKESEKEETGEYPHDPANGVNTNKGAGVNEDHGKRA